ncbi:hypothetical protein ACC724_40170, partial [Rhizobium ruizarguesonis]
VADFYLLSFFYSFQVHLAVAGVMASLAALLVKRHWYALLTLAVSVVLAVHGVVRTLNTQKIVSLIRSGPARWRGCD